METYLSNITNIYNDYILKHKAVMFGCGHEVTYYILFSQVGEKSDSNSLRRIIKKNFNRLMGNGTYCTYRTYMDKYMNICLLEEVNIRSDIRLLRNNTKKMLDTISTIIITEELLKINVPKDIISYIMTYIMQPYPS